MRILVFGAGVVGHIYGSLLHASGHHVSLYVKPGSTDRYPHGLSMRLQDYRKLPHDLLDLRAEIEIGDAAEVTLEVRGQAITYSAKDGKLKVLGREAPLKAVDGKVSLRVLLDRTTIKVFANDGALSMSSCCFAPGPT